MAVQRSRLEWRFPLEVVSVVVGAVVEVEVAVWLFSSLLVKLVDIYAKFSTAHCMISFLSQCRPIGLFIECMHLLVYLHLNLHLHVHLHVPTGAWQLRRLA